MANQPKKEMSRGAMTAWIVGTLLVMGFFGLGFYLDQDEPGYPGCTGFMGIQDKECRFQHALEHVESMKYRSY